MLSKEKYVLVSLGKSACPRASHAGFAKHEEEVCFNFNQVNQIEFAARNSPGKLLPTDRWVGAQTLRLPGDRGNPSSELQGQGEYPERVAQREKSARVTNTTPTLNALRHLPIYPRPICRTDRYSRSEEHT